MLKKLKKAFTIVELVIVIAVIAILAAVLIPTFINVTEQAKQSADQQLCRQYNTAIAIERVYDDDITLREVINVIEANGMAANKLSTSSKYYVFAYDRKNSTVVLLKKETGEIDYPANYDSSNSELWAMFPSDKKSFVKGVYNYLVTDAYEKYTGEYNFESGKDYLFDLDKNIYDTDGKSISNLKVTNGTVLGSTASAIIAAEDSTVNTTESGNVITSFSDSKFITTEKDGNIVISDYIFVNANNSAATPAGADYSKFSSTEKPVVIQNCTFIGQGLYFYSNNANLKNVTIDNCKFYNCQVGNQTASVMIQNESPACPDYTFTNNYFYGSVIGVKMTVAAKNIVFEGNTFDLQSISKSKSSNGRYDACIRFEDMDSIPESVTVKDNTVVNAGSLICIYYSLCEYVNSDTLKEQFIEKFTISGNNIEGAKDKTNAYMKEENDTGEEYKMASAIAEALAEKIQ